MHPPSRTPIVLRAPALAVRFTWAGDRWTHEVTDARGDALFGSVDGGRDDDGDPQWPPSPAFVEISRLGDGMAAPVMAVGQAGRTHFSAVILVDPMVPEAIRFDVAARIQGEPARLGSTYRPLGPGFGGRIERIEPAGGPASPPPRTARWCYRLHAGRIEALAGAVIVAPGRDADPTASSA